jgi:hypothetical protein
MQPVTKQRLIDAIGKVNSFRREGKPYPTEFLV